MPATLDASHYIVFTVHALCVSLGNVEDAYAPVKKQDIRVVIINTDISQQWRVLHVLLNLGEYEKKNHDDVQVAA